MRVSRRTVRLALAVVAGVPGLVRAGEPEDVRFEVKTERRVVQMGEYVVFRIQVLNEGESQARGLKVSAVLSDNFEATQTGGSETNALFTRDRREVKFPAIASLDPGRGHILAIRGRAKAPGVLTCSVSLEDPGLGGVSLRKDEYVRVR